MLLRSLFESANKTAVLGWGRGMGHKGHMLLAQAVIHHAQENNAKPFFVVSRTSLVDPSTGQAWADKPTFTKTKDDPLSPEEKLATYRKVFPQNADVFSVATADASTLDKVLAKIAGEGFGKVILIVGELEKASFSFLTRPDKSGVPPYQRAGLKELEIISRQDTTEPSSVKGSPSYQEGPRATPLRQVLLDPSKSEEEQFAVWRRDMPDNLSDEEVRDLMVKAKSRMMAVPAAKNKKQGVAEATGDERFDTIMGRMQKEPTIPDAQMPPTDVKDLYHWAVKHHKPYHKIFAKWANREGYKSVAPALMKAGNLDTDALDYWTPEVWKTYWGEVHGIDSEMPKHWSKERVPDELRDYLETVFDAYENIWQDWPTEYRQIGEQGVAEGLNEFAPSPGFGGDDDDDKYTPQNFGKPFKANYLGKNKFEVFCQPPGNRDPSKVIKLNAEVQKYGLEWDDDFGFWFLDSPGAVYLSWKYGEIPLPKAIDQARNPGHIHDLVTDYLTNSPHAAEIQKIATEYFGFTADGEMNEGVAEGLNEFAMSHSDDDEDPFDNYPCYDCGSTIFLHHTKLCELAEPNAKHDLPANPGLQHWTGEIPKGLHAIPGLQEADSPAIVHTAKSLENPPKVMQHRAKRDQERERQWMGTQIAKNDRTSKDDWGNLKELSNEKLGQYKKAAGAQATAADKAGDTKRADKRFSGIVKATKKQFSNDTKGVPVSEAVENIMDVLINKIIVNEAIQDKKR